MKLREHNLIIKMANWEQNKNIVMNNKHQLEDQKIYIESDLTLKEKEDYKRTKRNRENRDGKEQIC